MNPVDLSLYLVLDPVLCSGIGMVETARLAVEGGVTVVQLRDKHATTQQMIETGLALKKILAGTGVPLIVNDDVEAAIAIGADGVHVGQEDMTAAEVRAKVGPSMILGLSIPDEKRATEVDPRIVDYIGIGPVFPTPTKPDKPAIGFDGLARVVAASPVPTVAIGGLKLGHAARTFKAGADGICVISAICGQPDPSYAACQMAEEIRDVKQ